MQILVGHNDGVICCALNETFQVVISAASDNSVYAWDIDTGTIMSSFAESVKGSVTALDIAADGNLGLAGLHFFYTQIWLFHLIKNVLIRIQRWLVIRLVYRDWSENCLF